MMNVLDTITGELGTTKTYKGGRFFVWTPGSDLGHLTIKLQRAAGCGRKIEVDTYAVKEIPIRGLDRMFLLVNLADAAEHQLLIGPNEQCTCPAAECKVPEPCKHRAAMRHLVESGILDGLESEPRSGLWFEDDPGEPTRYETLECSTV